MKSFDNSLHKYALAILLGLFIMPAGFSAQTAIQETDTLQVELDSINLQIDYLNLKVKDTKKRLGKLERRIKNKKKSIRKLEQIVTKHSEKHAKISQQISELEEKIEFGQNEIKEILTRFRARLVQLHKIKQGTLLSSIFSAKNLNSFLNRYQMVKYLLKNDKELLNIIETKNRRLIENNQDLLSKKKEIALVYNDLEAKKAKLKSQNKSLKAMLSSLILEKKLFLTKQHKLKKSRKTLESEIDKIEKMRAKNQKAFDDSLANAPAIETTAPAIKPPKSKPLPNSAPKAAKLMNFCWPMASNLINSTQQTGEKNTVALKIFTSKETEILSCARGKVLYKGKLEGLGNIIIIGHTRGFSTVYAQLDDIWVGLGQIIKKGETIGRVFGIKNNPLHLEIRFGGKKQPPLDYLPPRS